MSERFSRTELVIGKENLEKLSKSHVAVFGIGGVGGYVAEALVRCGVGKIDIIDNDTVSESNINRQIYATTSNIGRYKTDVAEERMKDINPDVVVNKHNIFYMPDTSDKFDFSQYDYVVDAIDTVTGKLEIICNAEKAGVPVISSMGTGNKLNPSLFEITDIYKTSVCPLARVMRYELKKRGIKKLKVLYSKEEPIKVKSPDGSRVPGSIAFVPPVAGLVIAGEVVKDLIEKDNRTE